MPEVLKILMVEDVQVSQVLNTAETAMRGSGHEVMRYRDSAALWADKAALAQAEIFVFSSNFPCTRELLSTPQRLRAVVVPAIGTETIDVLAATELGIIIANGATSENVESMAESTVLLMLALLYDLNRSQALLRNRQPRPAELYAQMLKGRTIGLIGLGRIARAVVSRLEGWGVEFLAYTRRTSSAAVPRVITMVTLEELLKQSDVVSVHASLNDESRGMLNAQRLRLLKPSAILIDTARGGIIDEVALCEAVREKRIAGVALDTFAVEPLPADSPLRELPDAILTPHIVGHTVQGTRSLDTTVVENLMRVIRGEPPVHIRNPEVLPLWQARWSAATKSS